MESLLPSDEYEGWVSYFIDMPSSNEIQRAMMMQQMYYGNGGKEIDVNAFMIHPLSSVDERRDVSTMTAEEMHEIYGV